MHGLVNSEALLEWTANGQGKEGRSHADLSEGRHVVVRDLEDTGQMAMTVANVADAVEILSVAGPFIRI